MPGRSHVRTALEELRAIDRDAIPADLAETYERTLEDVETLYADLEVAAETDDQPTEQLDTKGWDEDDWEDQLAEAREKAEISRITGLSRRRLSTAGTTTSVRWSRRTGRCGTAQ